MNLLSIKNVKKSFTNLDVLKDISLDLKKGEITSIIGPSGSGKSTLLRCLSLLENIDSGNIEFFSGTVCKNVDNKAIYSNKKELKKISSSFSLVFQDFNLFPHLNVLENIICAPISIYKQNKNSAIKQAKELLEKLNLKDKENFYPYQLSGGQTQRVAIARALATHPKILFFDEPTSALDPKLTLEITKIIKELKTLNIATLIVTHDMNFAKEVSDKIIFMDKGSIIDSGSPKEIFESSNKKTREFLNNI